MQYSDIHKAVFLERPNRFIAHCTVDGMLETVHVKNTGPLPGIAGARRYGVFRKEQQPKS